MDLYFTENGDIAVTPSGDVATTGSIWRDDAQQAYMRCMTEIGDWTTYPTLGASLSQLYGLPQSPATGQFGQELISASLSREGRFAGRVPTIRAIPTGPQSIRFDVSIASGDLDEIKLSVERNLTPGG